MLSGKGVIWRTVVGRLDVINILLEVQSIDGILVQQRRVTQVVCHHYRRVQRAEIQCRDWHIIIAFLRLYDCGTFVLLVGP
jgi:hypothetical protein